jgi:phage-related minor tail protein
MANGAGLMGEAGPEAIMPLKRLSNGKLGVQASAPNNSVVVNVNISGIQDARGIREASANVAARTGAAVNAALARNR